MYRLPLFPLPAVLFPGARLPLHIFEPRYRRMIGRCLEFDRRFGLLYHDPDLRGPFLMEEGRVGTVAEIEEFRVLPDGRSLIVARGRERFSIREGIESGEPYYEGVVLDYRDPGGGERGGRGGRGANGGAGRDDRGGPQRPWDGPEGPRDGPEGPPDGPEGPPDGPEGADAPDSRSGRRGGIVERRRRSLALFHAVVDGLDERPDPDRLPELDPHREISFRLAPTIQIDPRWQQSLLELRDEIERLDRLDTVFELAMEEQG